MTSQRSFKLAGWLSISGAFAMVPVVTLSIAEVFQPDNLVLQRTNIVLSIVTGGLGIYVLLALKQLLHRHEFHAADLVLDLLIGGLFVGVVLELGGAFVLEPQIVDGLLLALAFILCGISVVFGITILPAAKVVVGPMRPFAYLTIMSSACLMTIILSPIGLIASIAGSVCLAMVFFRASEPSVAPAT